MSSVKIELQTPVKMAGVDVSELTMRAPKVRDMIAVRKIPGSDVEQEVALFANLCQVTPAAIEELDMRDYKKLQDAYSGFLS